MSFETEVQKILRREGGYVNHPADRGGETNFGISKRANPDVDVRNLTEEQAVELYRSRYWDAAQVDSFPEHMRGAIFDAAVHHGPGTARGWADRAGGDAGAFQTMRRQYIGGILQRDPSQQVFARGWMNRLAEFETGAALASAPRDRQDAWAAAANRRSVDRDTAWTSTAQGIRDGAGQRRGRSVRDPLGEASVDYVATLAALNGGDVADTYARLRGREAEVADQIAEATTQVDIANGVGDDYFTERAERQEALNAEQQLPTLREQYNYLWRESSATGALVSYFEEYEHGADNTPDENLNYLDHMHEWEKGRTPDEIDELRRLGRGAFNTEMIERTISRQDREREQASVMRGAGVGRTLGLSLAAGTVGDPLGMLAGFGAYKGFAAVGLGARQALVQGSRIGAFALGGAEAAVGNVAVTGMIDALGNQQSVSDYVMAAGFGFAMGAPFVALDIPGANVEAARNYFRNLSKMNSEAAAERVAHFNARAREELGPDAPEARVAARAQEMDAAEVTERARTILSAMPDNVRLAPEYGEDGLPTGMASEPPVADAALGDFYRRREGDLSWSESRELRAGLEAAEQSGRASDALRAVVSDTGAPQHLRDLAERLIPLADETGLGYVPNSELTGDPATWGGVYFRDTHSMSIKMARADFVVHEALHGATSNIIATPRGSLPAHMRPKVQRLADLQAHVQAHYGMNPDAAFADVLDDALGPLGNLQEFVTYAMTDKQFQQYLSSIPSPTGSAASDAWQWFKDLVADMLGIQGGQRTALDDVLEASGDLVDSATADLATTGRVIGTEAARAARMAEETADAAPAGGGRTAMPDDSTLMPTAAPGAMLTTRAQVDAVAKKYGLDASISDPVERAVSAEMYARAERILAENPIDEAQLKPLLSVVGWEATSTRMLLSKNPLMRATGLMLAENPEGAGGRHLTAALISHTRERVYRSAMEPEYDQLLGLFAKSKGKGEISVVVDPKIKDDFDRALSKEMISRWQDTGRTTDNEAVLRMADVLDQGYAMMGADMQAARVMGWGRLQVGKSGYFPRIMRGERVAALSADQRRALTQLMSDELQNTSGFDREFSDRLAVKLLERAADQSKGGWSVSLDLRSADTADAVRDALKAMNFSEEEVARVLGRFGRGGARFTKSRLDIDLNAVHRGADGEEFRLGDLFEHDQLAIYKNYARRASGEVALTQFGIMGAAGGKMLRKAMASAPSEFGATPRELEAFDQFMAEMLGTPFGTKLGKEWGNVRSLVSSAFLGGMGFTQLAESSNGLHAVGVAGVLKSIAGMPRLLREVRQIAKGEKVENSILKSVEVFNGEIGADQYRLVGLRDVGDMNERYGVDSLGKFSLAARGAAHATRVLSMQRAIEAVQVRGFSEQIVRKALRYVRDGVEDQALNDMGMTPQLREALVRNMDNITTWRNGELMELDLARMDDPLAARVFAALVDRGASQIIQRTYAGEVGKWAHSDHLLLLTQFRNYPLVATQKQWRRQAFTHGTAKAIGYIIGGTSIVLPVYLARLALQGIGRDDEWWEQRLSPMELGRAVSRYSSALGLTSDVIDAIAPLAGFEAQAGRSAATGAIPAISYFNTMGRAAIEKDPQQAFRLVTGNNIPWVVGGMNYMFFGDD